jgi:NADH:ubiquinone oxidoreductase subunit F (NADH-binding)
MASHSASDRGAESFFTYSGEDPDTVHVCRGLSCELNGAATLAARIGERSTVRPVYCVGFCDRSPALLAPGGMALCGAGALAWPAATGERQARPDIRSLSARPVVTERIARGSHASLTRARAGGAYVGLAKALGGAPRALLAMVDASGEQGRGGAGFPTAKKWQACADAAGARRYVVANGDEGDPGSFIDRILLEDDPHAVLEGLLLCGYAVGASDGIVFIRGEYPRAQAMMGQAIVEAREAGLLGRSVMGSPFSFEVRVVSGRGSYVCGEETALLNAIEGRRGEVRVRPPYPTGVGLHGCPTVVNNVETLVNIPWIVREGAAAFRRLGTGGSPGTKALCLNRGFARPGIIEVEFGMNLREVIEVHAGGAREKDGLAAVALGGPMGSVLTPADWDVALDYAELRRRNIRLGHGGIVAIPADANLRQVLLSWIEFMVSESCGKCAPCRTGSRRALDLGIRLRELPLSDARLAGELIGLMKTVEATSLCGFGQGIAAPVISLAQLALCDAAPRAKADD